MGDFAAHTLFLSRFSEPIGLRPGRWCGSLRMVLLPGLMTWRRHGVDLTAFFMELSSV